ncbi:hypothetical protein [Aeromicrobium ginsengisoli]|uniref:hypothetical protein n=1 Tax=Aeromicrobium ginsengisoli TaxID=363867 RepID=UPI00165EDD8F|nr:hypothetical protein [Aeromicrobium ginsengisoli]
MCRRSRARSRLRQRGTLTMPNGRRLPQDAVVVGRGAELHALVGSEWLSRSVADLA